MRSAYRTVTFLGVIVLTFCLVVAAPAADTPSGTVSLRATAVAAGIGFEWGSGMLTYQGKQSPFSVQGLEVVGVGYSEITAEGNASYGLLFHAPQRDHYAAIPRCKTIAGRAFQGRGGDAA